LEFEPGTRYQYSNAGINTAGRIIEVVTGMPYQQFMQQRLFKPLGMKDTTFWPNASQLKRLAKSYKPTNDKTGLEETTVTQLHYPLSDRSRQPMPAGGLFSTAQDVARFCWMILNHGELEGKRYLSQAAVEQMTQKQTGDQVKEGYGFGWSTSGKKFGHGGAYATNMDIDTQRGLVLIWMVQHAGFPGKGNEAQQVFRQAAERMVGNQ
jgi:CubicO group peptidase (beta-lactamase class C family)